MFNEYLIDMIYAQHDAATPLVVGFNWAYDLRPVRKEPLDRQAHVLGASVPAKQVRNG